MRLQGRRADERGSALIITMLMIAVLTGLALTVFALSVDNLGNARRDRQATAALANSEAGISQAIAYVKLNGLGRLRCAPNCGAANPWGESAADGDADPGTVVTPGSGERYEVWIEPISPMGPTTPGRYRVHSIGNAGTGPGSRKVEVDIAVAPFEFPLAVYADSVQAGGTGSIHTASLFSKGCIFKRSRITFAGIDPVYNIPAAAHSAQYITDTQGAGAACSSTDNKNIHKPGQPCNTAYPYDQDLAGGPLDTTPCFRPAGAPYPTTSLIPTGDSLGQVFDFDLAGLSPAQLDLLRTAAQEQGFYFTNTTAVPAVLQDATTSLNFPNPVLFYDLKGAAIGGQVDLNGFSSSTYGRPVPLVATSASCTSRNVLVVVVNGNVKLNSNQTLVGSVFAMGPAPNGEVSKANGNSKLIGTVYARSIDLTGTADIHLDDCFLENLPGNLLSVKAEMFREVDR